MSEMRVLLNYISSIDGSTRNWDEVKPLFENLFHRNLKVVVGEKERGYEEWERVVQNLIKAGGRIDVERIVRDEEDGGIATKYHIQFPAGPKEHVEGKMTFEDGKVIRMEVNDGNNNADAAETLVAHALTV